MARDRKRRRRDGERRPASRREVRQLATAAARRGGLPGELVRYAIVCAVLLAVAQPIGLAVAFFWGVSILRRLSGGRDAAWPAPDGSAPRHPPDEVRPLIVPLRLAELVQRECSARAARLAERGIELVLEPGDEGALEGDAESLGLAVGDLLDAALAELEGGEKPRLALELGENLAGSEVWLRLRGARGEPAASRAREPAALERAEVGAARRIAHAHGGHLEALALRQGEIELLLTLPRPGSGSDRP